MSIANYVPKHRRKAVSLMLHKAKAKRRMEREHDEETQRMRAMWDAKGQVERFGVTYTATGERPWVMRRSVAGRINQVDLVIDNSLWRTGSERAANSAIKYGKWPCY